MSFYKKIKKLILITIITFFTINAHAKVFITKIFNRVKNVVSGQKTNKKIRMTDEPKQLDCLRQSGLDCGFNATYNTISLAKDESWLLDRERLNKNLAEWRKYVIKTNGYSTNIGSYDIENLINNFEILEPLRDSDSFFIIDNVYELEIAFEGISNRTLDESFVKYYKDNFIKKIENFRNGSDLEIIVNFASDNLSDSNSGAHWVGIKFEWQVDGKILLKTTNSLGSDITKSDTINRVSKLIAYQELP